VPERIMTRDNKDLLVGLDIGTSKVVAIVAELHADGEIEVIGTGQHESNGLKKGVVVDIEKTVASIQAALEEAEITSGNKIQQVVTGIAGSHIRSFNSIGMVAIKDKEVTEADVARVIETAKANDYEALIIADHGNADNAINEDGTPNTAHSLNPVPFIYVTDNNSATVKSGRLADVAPSILHIMGLEQPSDMTGECLISDNK